MTADIVALICFIFALAYFLVAGGVQAFRLTFRKRSTPSSTTTSDELREKLGGQIGVRRLDDDAISARSRRSSSFHMVGPTAPSVSRMRLQSTIEDLSPGILQGLHPGGSGHRHEEEMIGSGLINSSHSKDKSPGMSSRKRRLFSDVDGLHHPRTFSHLDNSIDNGQSN